MRPAVILAVALLLVSATTVLAAPPTVSVSGHYSYSYGGGTSEVTIDATGIKPTGGTFTFTRDGVLTMTGDVTCIAVDGPDAWVAGPTTDSAAGDEYWAIRVHDGGSSGDLAITRFGKKDALQNCVSFNHGADHYMQPVTGDLTVTFTR
jgi:hypothetical protein